MAFWVITTSGWLVLAAHFAGATPRLVFDPVVAGAAVAGALALAGGTVLVLVLLRARVRRPRPRGRST